MLVEDIYVERSVPDCLWIEEEWHSKKTCLVFNLPIQSSLLLHA
jgi:hypothetical protein